MITHWHLAHHVGGQDFRFSSAHRCQPCPRVDHTHGSDGGLHGSHTRNHLGYGTLSQLSRSSRSRGSTLPTVPAPSSVNQRTANRALTRPPRWPHSRPCTFSSDNRLCRWRRNPPCTRGSRESPDWWKSLPSAQLWGEPALPQGKALPLQSPVGSRHHRSRGASRPAKLGGSRVGPGLSEIAPARGDDLCDVLDRKRGTCTYEGDSGKWCPMHLSTRHDLADYLEVEALVNSRLRARLEFKIFLNWWTSFRICELFKFCEYILKIAFF